MPDALAYTPTDTPRRRATVEDDDTDLVAVIRRVLAEKKKREQGDSSGESSGAGDLPDLAAPFADGGDIDPSLSVDLSLVPISTLVPRGSTRTTSNAGAGLPVSTRSPVDLAAGQIEAAGVLNFEGLSQFPGLPRTAYNEALQRFLDTQRPFTGPASTPLSPGETGSTPSSPVSLGPEGQANLAGFLNATTLRGPTLTAGPVSFTPSFNPVVSAIGKALGLVGFNPALISLLSASLAGALGQEANAQGIQNDVVSQDPTVTSNPSDSAAFAKALDAAAPHGGISTPAGRAAANATAPPGLALNATGTGFTTNFGARGDEQSEGGAPGGTPGGGPPGSSDSAASPEAPFLATWAMQGLGAGADKLQHRGWSAFHRMFTKRFPLTGEQQFRRYARLARQVVDAIEQRSPLEQRRAQEFVYRRIVAPLGETLELHEVDEAWSTMRATALALARQIGLDVDPADVPQPLHEITARAKAKRAKARAEARGDEETTAPEDRAA